MSMRTYGDKPISFQVEDGGEFYCVGSEVCTTSSARFGYTLHDSNVWFMSLVDVNGLSYNLMMLSSGGQLSPALPRVALQEVPGHGAAYPE